MASESSSNQYDGSMELKKKLDSFDLAGNSPCPKSFGKTLRLSDFGMDPGYLNLNHASFGTYPKCLDQHLTILRLAAEARPDLYLRYTYPALLDISRAAIAEYVHVDVNSIVFVPNATTGVATIFANLAPTFVEGDRIVYFSHVYGSCGKIISWTAESSKAEAICIEIDYPVSDDWIVQAFRDVVETEAQKGNRVKVLLFDTISSLPGVRMPFERLVAVCRELGVLSLVDGAHAVGLLDLNLDELDADFFVSNCHKWLLTPRPCAILHVPTRNQKYLRTTMPTSHGFIPLPSADGRVLPNPLPQSDKPGFVTNFEFVGTFDASPFLVVPYALQYRKEVLGGEEKIREYCLDLAKQAGKEVASMWGTEVLENEDGTLGYCFLTNVRLPLDAAKVVTLFEAQGREFNWVKVRDWITLRLLEDADCFAALYWARNAWWVRLAAHVYVEMDDFLKGARGMSKICEEVVEGKFL